MDYFTAQVDEATGFVNAVTKTSEPLSQPPQGILFVPLDGPHPYAGYTYNAQDGTFTAPAQP